ncbi:hypothetical protein RchiOBHm_Chr6g0265761 [Rosa chinensis]|uniref:Uncharacterized protein n=1 Tax=Rosa chinensis TaxID=74649 RepID=A0A2P6PPJ5_ROSCH|nr:hypothetical protein RchiOBHm_Chr6g0265761 [Rosa chinensis]
MSRTEGLDEVDDYGALDWGKVIVPNEIDGDVAFEKSVVVVLEHQWLLLH